MRISDDLRKCVVFLGYEDDTEPGNIKCIGTGFLLRYKEFFHLVTVKHVAITLGEFPFIVRANLVRGGAENIPGDQIEWFYHSDENVDLAIIPFRLLKAKYDALYIPEKIIKSVGEYNIGIGDVCYTIGLFRLLYGSQKNLPVVHTGNIAMVPEDEKIPVEDWDNIDSRVKKSRYIEGYLIGSQSLDGLSGAPVFARPTTDENLPCLKSTEDDISGERFSISDVFLIGIWQGSWTAPPDEVMAREIEIGRQTRVPLGMGVVVPVAKLLELLESPQVQKKRDEFYAEREANVHAAELDVVRPHADNPQHKEDFNSLLTAAAKKKPPADET
jgi:hypothetical protein